MESHIQIDIYFISEEWKHNKNIMTFDCESGQFYWQIITCPANCSDSSYVCLVITVFQEQEEEEEEWGGRMFNDNQPCIESDQVNGSDQ